MYERPLYRPCPICRTQLVDVTEKLILRDEHRGWKAYECPNCGSTVFIHPFAGVIEGKVS